MTVQPMASLAPEGARVITMNPRTAVGDALEQLRAGGLVILHDTHRNEGDLIASARLIDAATVTTMTRSGRGLVSVALTERRARQLGLRALPQRRAGGRALCERTPAFVSLEARVGVSTGISAADRAQTIATTATGSAADLVSPGHIFPLVASAGGLLERYGRLEAATDAVRLAGLEPVAAICDVLDDDGKLALGEHLTALASELGVPLVTIGELVEARFDDAWAA